MLKIYNEFSQQKRSWNERKLFEWLSKLALIECVAGIVSIHFTVEIKWFEMLRHMPQLDGFLSLRQQVI